MPCSGQVVKFDRRARRDDAQAVVEAAQDFEGALGLRIEDTRQGPPKLNDLPRSRNCAARASVDRPARRWKSLRNSMMARARRSSPIRRKSKSIGSKRSSAPCTAARVSSSCEHGCFHSSQVSTKSDADPDHRELVLALHGPDVRHCRPLPTSSLHLLFPAVMPPATS
jgi:hypothetical protein